MQYKIEEVISVYPSKFPDSKQYKFKVAGRGEIVSAFSKFPMEAGMTINGEIVQKGQYYNWTWEKKSPVQTIPVKDSARVENLIEFKVIPMLQSIYKLVQNLPEDTQEADIEPRF